jgi:hypothetical protein
MQSNKEDSEVTMDTPMPDMDSLPPLDRVAQQILSELRDFRKEWSERNTREERVEFGPRAPTVTSSIPGQYPGSASTAETVSGVHIELSGYLPPMERAKLESYYESEISKLREEVKFKKQLWEDARLKTVDLSQQLAEQTAKVTKLQRMMARAGRNDNTNIDSDIGAQFVVLKSSILQMVKNHLSYHARKPRPSPSPELGELYLREIVAVALYNKFFSREAMPFGFNDHLDKNTLRSFEETLRQSHCDESAIKEWRIATVKACKLLNRSLSEYAFIISNQIWNKTLRPYFDGSKPEVARRELDGLCQKAAELAILFRGSTIEYEWEQDINRLESFDINLKDHDIIQTRGPSPDEEGIEISFIVFGGVVRGDKSTGLLENGRTRLSKSQVVIDFKPSAGDSVLRR